MDANRTAVGVVEETTAGTTPATPAFENLRVLSSSLAYAKKTGQSKQLRSDRQIDDLITLGFDAGGDIPQEASYGACDTFIRGALASEWVFSQVRANITGTLTNITAVSATAITVAAGALTSLNSGAFAVGMLVRASGFTAAGNNRLFRAAATTSNTSIVMTGGTVDAAPIAGSRVKMIGFEGAAGDLVATASGLTSTALDFTTLGLDPGEWVYVGGSQAANAFAAAGTKGWCRVAAAGGVTATSLPFDIVPTAWGVDAGAAKTIRVYTGDYIRNGVTKRSYTVELQYQDLAVPEFEYYTGMCVASMKFTVASQSIMGVSTTLMGFGAVDQTARFAGATDVAAPTNDVINTSANIGTILDNGQAIPGVNILTSVEFTVNNSLRRRIGLGSAQTISVGYGEFQVAGSMSLYYGSNYILNKIRNSTASSLFLPIVDNSGSKALLVDIPKLKFGDGNPTVPGVDTDRMIDPKFQGLRHAVLNYMLHIARYEEFGT